MRISGSGNLDGLKRADLDGVERTNLFKPAADCLIMV
jgi:hypothetical protein